MSGCSLVVLKCGSSVLRNESDLPAVAEEIAGHVARGWRVLAVVSAIGNGTEELIRRARSQSLWQANSGHATPVVSDEQPPANCSPAHCSPRTIEDRRDSAACAEAAFAALLATGEAVSAALVGLALHRRGIDSTVLDVGRVGPFTRGPLLDAEPHALDTWLIKRALAARPVAVLPGFVGRDDDGSFTLLGRGGSDLTALFAARVLHADRCRLLKDVEGVFEYDPALRGPARPRRYATLDWDGALRLEDCILQRRAVQFAYRHRLPFEVGATGDNPGTVVGAPETRYAHAGRRDIKSTGRPHVPACDPVAAEGGVA